MTESRTGEQPPLRSAWIPAQAGIMFAIAVAQAFSLFSFRSSLLPVQMLGIVSASAVGGFLIARYFMAKGGR